jgi:hypothetical protein
MIRFLLALASVMLLAAAGAAPRPDNIRIPSEIRMKSPIGEVLFKHQAHITDRAIPCVECHHQINAKKLDTPHPEYLQSSWINCKVCHDEGGKMKAIYTCSACHDGGPRNIADETLSSKVVVHKQCWKCHQAGTGKDASSSCQLCHSGKKNL